MFEAKFRNLAIFRQLINTVDKTVNLLNFSCDINGMSMESMNGAKCIYISMFWPKSEFQKYFCDKKTGWTIDAKILSKTLKMSELDSETCILKLTDDNPDEILVEFNNAQSGLVRKVYMKLMEHEDIYFPAFSNVDIKFIIDSKDFQQEIAKMISCKKVQIQATENSVIFKGKTDLQRIHIEFPLHSNHNNDTSLEVMDSYFRDNNSVFLRKMVTKASKMSGRSETVELKFLNGICCVEYKIRDNGHIRFFLAPVVDGASMHQ